jgi:hypothetical protein
VAAERLEEDVGFGQVLAVRALALVQVRDGVEPEPIDSAVQPEVEDLEEGWCE